MFKKSAIVATAAAGLLAIGSPAFATGGGYDKETDIKDNNKQIGLVNIHELLSNNNICDVIEPTIQVVNILGSNDTGDTVCTQAEADS